MGAIVQNNFDALQVGFLEILVVLIGEANFVGFIAALGANFTLCHGKGAFLEDRVACSLFRHLLKHQKIGLTSQVMAGFLKTWIDPTMPPNRWEGLLALSVSRKQHKDLSLPPPDEASFHHSPKHR